MATGILGFVDGIKWIVDLLGIGNAVSLERSYPGQKKIGKRLWCQSRMERNILFDYDNLK